MERFGIAILEDSDAIFQHGLTERFERWSVCALPEWAEISLRVRVASAPRLVVPSLGRWHTQRAAQFIARSTGIRVRRHITFSRRPVIDIGWPLTDDPELFCDQVALALLLFLASTHPHLRQWQDWLGSPLSMAPKPQMISAVENMGFSSPQSQASGLPDAPIEKIFAGSNEDSPKALSLRKEVRTVPEQLPPHSSGSSPVARTTVPSVVVMGRAVNALRRPSPVARMAVPPIPRPLKSGERPPRRG